MNETRRGFLSFMLKVPGVAQIIAMTPLLRSCPPRSGPAPQPSPTTPHYDVVVVGSGFGGSMTALTIARAFKKRDRGEKVLILERGAWWTTPVETVADKETVTRDFLEKTNKQPVRVWVSGEHLRGLFDLAVRCVRRPGQRDGLYDITTFKAPEGDVDPKLTVIRANGVGGGSLIYQNVTIEPPDSVLQGWPMDWSKTPPPIPSPTIKSPKELWYDLARDAIGHGILNAWDSRDPKGNPTPPNLAGSINTGLSNIVTRTSGLNPHFHPGTQHVPDPKTAPDQARQLPLWLDRSRVFQAAAAALDPKPDAFGAVDLAINDVVANPTQPANLAPDPKNYCERQGRCILGCLPGARHTLNKQLMMALYGTPKDKVPQINVNASDTGPAKEFLRLEALSEVASIEERKPEEGKGWVVVYEQGEAKDPRRTKTQVVTADRVILAAGCIATSHLLLKARRSTLPGLSPRVGEKFSNNGDYLAFIEQTKETVSLSRGPMATSFAHFNAGDREGFHTLEDAGLPRMLSVLFGRGLNDHPGSAFVAGVAKSGLTPTLVADVLVKQVFRDFKNIIDDAVKAFLIHDRVEPGDFQAEELDARRVLCVAAMGRDQASASLALGDSDEEAPRLKRPGGPFNQDPIYRQILPTISRLASQVRGDKRPVHKTPYDPGRLYGAQGRPGAPDQHTLNPDVMLGSLHPLGGCPMGRTVADGVVNEYGQVFQTGKAGAELYPGLYIADASIIPEPLGVNPSLTISALALRIARKIVEDQYPVA